MADQGKARSAPRVGAHRMASMVTLFTGDLMVAASTLTREEYQALVMMAVDFQAFGTEPDPAACEGFEGARRWFDAMRGSFEAARNYALTTDARALADGAPMAELYGPIVAEWCEG